MKYSANAVSIAMRISVGKKPTHTVVPRKLRDIGTDRYPYLALATFGGKPQDDRSHLAILPYVTPNAVMTVPDSGSGALPRCGRVF